MGLSFILGNYILIYILVDNAMDILNVHSCYLCEKNFRKNERICSLENYEALWKFVMANQLIRINLHNGCYMKLYNKKRNA